MRFYGGLILGAASLVQPLLSFSLLTVAISAAIRMEDTTSSLKTLPQWQVNLQNEFSCSLKLARKLLFKTKKLTQRYLTDHLPGIQNTLINDSGLRPLTTLDLRTWISLPDAERLSYMAKMLLFYQELVQQLRDYETAKKSSKFVAPFEDLNFSLRDLSHHVSYQISLARFTFVNHPEPTLRPPQILQNQNQWRNHQNIYLVLCSLENFLARITRDFAFLRTRPSLFKDSKL